MADVKELSDKALENVTGGVRRTVQNDSNSSSYVRSGPGRQYGVVYEVYNGDTVYTTGSYVNCGGYVWYELDDGNYIAGSLIGY